MERSRNFIALLIFTLVSFSVAASDGQVTFFLFKGDQPAAGVKVIVSGQGMFTSNSDGVIDLDLAQDSYQAKIEIAEDEYQDVKFKVINGETTFINYTVLDDKKNNAEVLVPQTPFKETAQVSNGKADSVFKGQVSSFHQKVPVAGARVLVHGTSWETKTDAKGNFELKLPAGSYSISFIHDEYSTNTFHELTLNNKRPIVESVLLKPSGMELEEFVVLAPNLKSSVNALLEVRRGHQAVADVIGAEQISKSGDSDAGSSLKRVTGLSLVEGKYVYVRGLGERYSSTLLNEAYVPSPDPSRRVVPLDLFPASVIENMIVQKGYSPEMPGEFGGGAIQIKTKTLPAKAYTKVSMSTQMEAIGDVTTYAGGTHDWNGFDSGIRQMPTDLRNYLDQGVNISTLNLEERKRLGQSINKSYNTVTESFSEKARIPNFTLSTGNRYKIGKVRVGHNIAALYSNRWRLDTEDRFNYNMDSEGLVLDSNSSNNRTVNNVKLGALLGIGAKYKNHRLDYRGSILRNTTNFVRQTQGLNSEQEDYRRTELGWRERSIQTHQIAGESTFKSLNKGKLKWNYTSSEAIMDEPDNKMYTYMLLDGAYQVETENGSASNNVSWRYMPDTVKDINAVYEQPFSLGFIKTGKLSAGINRMQRQREFISNTFYYKFDNSLTVDPTASPDDVFSGPGAELHQQANNTDNYSANQTIDGYFVNVSMAVAGLKLASGVRYENSIQQVESYKLFNGGSTVSTLETRDFLPAVSLTYKVLNNLQMRANYSETVSRPELREVSNTTWNDVDQGAKFKGNPRLRAAVIKNWGVRAEWFPNRGEVISLGYFNKNFENPIEAIFGSLNDDGTVVGTTDTQYTFLNITEAQSRGVELEMRKKLPWFFTLGGNYTWIQSEVNIAPEIAGQLTSLQRPLQGQSPYLLNVQLDFEPKTKTVLSLLYNTMGRRITGVGADGRPDEYQEEITSLDFVASQKFAKVWNLKFRARNLLDPEFQRTQGDQVTQSIKRGREFSLGLSASF